MTVSVLIWLSTISAIALLFICDFIFHVRHAHAPQLREVIVWSIFYIALGLIFGVVIGFYWDFNYAIEYWAGYLTEKSLSIDNLFVFALILSKFQVPAIFQQKVLLIGIAIALIMRGIFIAIGAVAIENFSWVFYVFGAILLYSAWGIIQENLQTEKSAEKQLPMLTQWIEKVLPMSTGYNGGKLLIQQKGKWVLTPISLVVIVLGLTDLIFALDSIPAIYGLTQVPYIVFTANAFALLGLIQLFFLLEKLLTKLVYLSLGLSVILAFIGIKLIIHAMHHNQFSWLNAGKPITWIPEISSLYSICIILCILLITLIASLWNNRAR